MKHFFWDDEIVDKKHTTAEKRLQEPVRREAVLTCDKPWEGDGCGYFHTLYDEKKRVYRLYYLGFSMFRADGTLYHLDDVRVCCAESKDGIRWKRPDLGIVSYNGDTHNNIILESSMLPGLVGIDNFFVTVDTNPAPAVKGRFKAVMQYTERNPDGPNRRCLASFTSEDGYHFTRFGTVTDKGWFDTLNTVMWHEKTGRYLCYMRSYHDKDTGGDFDRSKDIPLNSYVRDIRVLTSKDFIRWTEPERVKLSSRRDFPLYTNCVSVYPAGDMLVGFPTRYTERHEWSPSFDALCGREKRLARMKQDPRFGLAVTDCLFMCSHDGKKWTIYDEAFLRPGSEHPNGWVYGSCYPSVGFIETPGAVKDSEKELSFYCYENHWTGEPAVLYRTTIRRDGFVSRRAGYTEKKLMTKPFVCEAGTLHLNLSTSARGYVKAMLTNTETGQTRESAEYFGDSTDKKIELGDLTGFAGKKTTLTLTMSDADVYAFWFE